MHRFPIAALILALFAHVWASKADAQPVLEVLSADKPIFDGVVQLEPGDQSVTITFGIVPEVGVTRFDAVFETGPEVRMNQCGGVGGVSTSLCFFPDDLRFTSDQFWAGDTAPFEIGFAVISVDNAAPGDALTTVPVSFIEEGMDFYSIDGQVVATVVPEPDAALALGVSLATLGALARSRRSGATPAANGLARQDGSASLRLIHRR